MHPDIFSIGPMVIHSYGVMVALGVAVALFIFRRTCGKIGFSYETAADLTLMTLIFGFLGARLFYVIQFWPYYAKDFLKIFMIWQGGLVVYGGFFGGFLGFFLYVKKNKLPAWVALDFITPAGAIAQGFGRMGCFLNGCCYGLPTHLPWAVKFPILNEAVHPTQIYESIYCFVLGFSLLVLSNRKLKPGAVALLYFSLYALGRFVIEFFRGDNAHLFLDWTLAQWVSICILFLCFFLFLSRRRVWKQNS